MRYAILSDIHGNLDALQAVLGELSGERVDRYVCLGDIVGYGPEPAECLREIRRCAASVVAGNHDFALCEKIDITYFNVFAREAILWTRSVLSESDVEYVEQLPLVEHLNGIDLVHGSLCGPELFDYLQTSYDAYLTMERMQSPVCFIGHSHVPIAFVQNEVISYRLEPEIRVEPDTKVIVNVGSVGQPRDKDPRACYALYDTEEMTVRIRRTRYDVDSVAAKIREAGLPAALGERLKVGR